MLPIYHEPTAEREARSSFRLMPLLAALLVVAFCGAVARHVAAQVAATTEENVARPFTLPTQKSEVNDDLADFARHTKKAAWDRAFKSLQKVLDANPQGLMQREDGLMVPSQSLIRKSITDLPPEGRDAFRVFHDPEAKKLVEEAQALPAGSPEELGKLEHVYHNYFITSVGDRAADRLGDIYFEQGNYSRSLECWRSIVQHHRESTLPRAQLLIKTATASARLGRWDDVRDLHKEIAERHAADQVLVAGKSQSAVEFITQLLTKAGEAPAAFANAQLPPDLPPPAAKEPTWQFRMLSQTDAATFRNMGQNWGWGVSFTVSEMLPTAVADAQRVYVNLMGHHFAVDLRTGKLLWRSVRIHKLAEKAQNPQMLNIEQYGLTLSGDHLYTVYRDPAQIGQQMPFRLAKLEAATGKEIWSTANIPEVQTWSMMGAPVVAGDRILLGAINPQQATEQRIVAINAADGKLVWNTHIGTHQMDPNQLYGRRSSQPAIVVHRDKAFVETHAGALVALDLRTGGIEWAFQYESEMLQSPFGWWGGNQSAPQLTTAGDPLIANGVLYFKGMRSKRLNAIDLSGPTVLWQRPINQPAMVVGADSKYLYLGGDGLTAIDLKTKALKWSNQINAQSGFARPIVTQNRLFQFTGRGVYEIDGATGDQKSLFRGGDLESYGGNIIVTKDALVTVSNLSISAYRFSTGTPAAPSADPTAGAATDTPAGGGDASATKTEPAAENNKAP